MKKHTALLVLAVALLGSGCASVHEKYKNTGWYTPDGFNYTYATDDQLKPDGHWFGASWSLK